MSLCARPSNECERRDAPSTTNCVAVLGTKSVYSSVPCHTIQTRIFEAPSWTRSMETLLCGIANSVMSHRRRAPKRREKADEEAQEATEKTAPPVGVEGQKHPTRTELDPAAPPIQCIHSRTTHGAAVSPRRCHPAGKAASTDDPHSSCTARTLPSRVSPHAGQHIAEEPKIENCTHNTCANNTKNTPAYSDSQKNATIPDQHFRLV